MSHILFYHYIKAISIFLAVLAINLILSYKTCASPTEEYQEAKDRCEQIDTQNLGMRLFCKNLSQKLEGSVANAVSSNIISDIYFINNLKSISRKLSEQSSNIQECPSAGQSFINTILSERRAIEELKSALKSITYILIDNEQLANISMILYILQNHTSLINNHANNLGRFQSAIWGAHTYWFYINKETYPKTKDMYSEFTALLIYFIIETFSQGSHDKITSTILYSLKQLSESMAQYTPSEHGKYTTNPMLSAYEDAIILNENKPLIISFWPSARTLAKKIITRLDENKNNITIATFKKGGRCAFIRKSANEIQVIINIGLFEFTCTDEKLPDQLEALRTNLLPANIFTTQLQTGFTWMTWFALEANKLLNNY